MKIEGSIGTVFELASIPDLWLESSYNEAGWSFEGETRDGQELSLQTVWNELVPNVSLPMELECKIKDVQLKIGIGNATAEQRDYLLDFQASIATHIKPVDGFESELNIEKIHFTYKKIATDAQQTTVSFHLKANAHVNDFLVINDCSLDFNYAYIPEKQSHEWDFKGDLYVQAFERLLHFKTAVAVLKEEQSFSFLFDTTNIAIHGTYFNKIKGTTSAAILSALNNGKAPENQQLNIDNIPADFSKILEEKFTPEQIAAIEKIIERAKRSSEPLITIPDVLNNNKPLVTVTPNSFGLKLERKQNKFKSLDIAIGSDLAVYNTLADQTTLFSIKNGMLTTGFDTTEKKFYLAYNSTHTTIKPLGIIGLLPGIQEALRLAFSENAENQPKTVAFLNMLEVQPKGFKFLKKDTQYNVDASIRLVLNDNLKIVDKDLYEFFEKLFPKSGEERFIEGSLQYDSDEGLLFILRNNNGIEIPNAFAYISQNLDAEFKENFRKNTGITIDAALDIGESFFLLDQVRLKIAKEIEMDMRIAFGLPSKLNDRFFNPESKLHGLINCYDREKFKKYDISKDTTAYETKLPDDGLLRANLKFSSSGISGNLLKFNVFNLEKVAEEFEGFVTETSDSVIIDLNALTTENTTEYGKLSLKKIEFKLDFKKTAFTIKGGIQVLSDSFKIPVRPVLKKLISILPPDSIDTKRLYEVANLITEAIELKSLSFYNEKTKQVYIDELLNFFRQFLLQEHQNLELLPKELIEIINTVSSEISAILPEEFLKYLSIDIPPGFSFELEITPDSSFSFNLEVSEPTEEQRKAGFSEHFQVLIPDVTMPPTGIYGVRLKKIGLGTALFSQAIRLDLSGELANFKYADLIAGAGYELVRKSNREDKKLQYLLPDVKTFGMNYKIENLIMFIFIQTVVPIPVPVFYDEFTCYSAGFDGSITDFSVKFPRPELNFKTILQDLGNLKTFFSEKEFVLPISNYGTTNQHTEKGLLPNFSAGPIAFDLPGILGSEKAANGEKKKITLGFKDVITFNPKDLVALCLNTSKFGIQSIVDKKKYAIKINEERSEYPINYLVKYLPLSHRINSKTINFLDLFEGEFAWVLCTPDEFMLQALPELISKEEEKNNTITTLEVPTYEIIQMLPKASEWTSEDQGVITAIKGRISLGTVLKMNAILVSAITDSQGLYSGIFLNTQIASLLNVTLKSSLQITPKEAHKFQMKGATIITILDDLPVLNGEFLLGIGEKSVFHISGMLDVFPFENSPIKLYSGSTKGSKTKITGIINEHGVVLGHINEDGNVIAAGIHLEIGDFHVSGTTRILNTTDKGAWEINLMMQDAIMSLQAGYEKIENGKRIGFGINTNKAIDFYGIVKISNTAGDKGPDGSLKIRYTDGNIIPILEEFYLDASINVLGFSSAAKIEIDATKFSTKLSADLGIINYELDLEGANLNDIGTFRLKGKLGLLQNTIATTFDAAFLLENGLAIFRGNSTFEFLGKTFSDWTITASLSLEEGPKFEVEGALDLFHIPNVFYLHSGNPGLEDKLKGSLTKDELHISGNMQLHLAMTHLSGTTLLSIKNNDFLFKTNLTFTRACLFSGFTFDLNISKDQHILVLNGLANGKVTLIENVLELASQNTVNIRVNESQNNLELFSIEGATSIFGSTSNYTVLIEQTKFKFNTSANLPLLDISMSGESSNLADINQMLVSGHIDFARLNAEIDKLYGDLLNNVQAKMNAKKEEIKEIKDQKETCVERIRILEHEKQEKERKLIEIQRIYNSWKGNILDPGAANRNFNLCVPPIDHVEYWHSHKVWIPFHPFFGRIRYDEKDLAEVKRYYQYIRELNLNIQEPSSEFGAEAKRLFNAVAGILNDAFINITKTVTDTIRDVGNTIHRVFSDEILKKLNIDTTNIDAINRTFNDGINLIQEGAKKWHELNEKLLAHKPFEIQKIEYTNQSVAIFTTKKLNAMVTLKILGEQKAPILVELNLENPLEGIKNTALSYMSAEMKAVMP